MTPMRFSWLKHMARSPAHCLWAMEEAAEETLAMRLGSGGHAILLDKPYALWEGRTNSGACRPRSGKDWTAFEEAHAGEVILNESEYETAQAMASAVRRHSEARRLLFAPDVVHEQPIEWVTMGRPCAGTPDARSKTYVVDLKTTRCAEPDRFVRDGTFRHYPAQLAWYLDGVKASGLGTPSEAYIVAVESTPPHPVTVLRLTDSALTQGRKACRVWLERLLGCERDNYWPAYVEAIVPFDVEEALELEFGDAQDVA